MLGHVTPLNRYTRATLNGVKPVMSYNANNPNFLEFWVEMNKWAFQHQPRKSHDAYLVILIQIHYKLSHGGAKFPRILSQNSQKDFEGPGQRPLLSIPAESIPQCMYGANFMIPADICDQFLCGQGKIYIQMDRRRQRQYPFGLKVSEWLILTALLGTADIRVHIIHISRLIITYTLESLSSLTHIIFPITHNLQVMINLRKN